jgi:hypothetical protein
MSTRGLDEVLADLAEVQDRLLAIPADDFSARAELSNRQDALRSEASRVRRAIPDHLSADQLDEQIAHLESEIVAHLDTRPSASAGGPSGGMGGGGIDPDKLHEMHRKMATSFGLDEKRAVLRRIKARRKELRGD